MNEQKAQPQKLPKQKVLAIDKIQKSNLTEDLEQDKVSQIERMKTKRFMDRLPVQTQSRQNLLQNTGVRSNMTKQGIDLISVVATPGTGNMQTMNNNGANRQQSNVLSTSTNEYVVNK